MVVGATDGYRMLAVCLIGQALDDIGPRTTVRPMVLRRLRTVPEDMHSALRWIAGHPGGLSADTACTLAGIPTDTLRREAADRLAGQGWRMPDLLATVAA